jgi:hypothetical protein
MGKVDVYFSDYLVVQDTTENASKLLSSNACIIGMPLKLVWLPDENLFAVNTVTGENLGKADPKNKLAIRECLAQGNEGACWLSLVWYDNADQLFHAEIVYQFYNVKASQTVEKANLDAFTQHTSERLAQGKRPIIELTGAGWDQVLATGDWESPDQRPYPINTKRNSGNVILKRKRSLSDKLVMDIISGSPAKRWGISIAFIVIVLVIIFLVCRCTMGA